jgi:hypothetical protein
MVNSHSNINNLNNINSHSSTHNNIPNNSSNREDTIDSKVIMGTISKIVKIVVIESKDLTTEDSRVNISLVSTTSQESTINTENIKIKITNTETISNNMVNNRITEKDNSMRKKDNSIIKIKINIKLSLRIITCGINFTPRVEI